MKIAIITIAMTIYVAIGLYLAARAQVPTPLGSPTWTAVQPPLSTASPTALWTPVPPQPTATPT